jgi:hypothetical protein
MTVEGTNRSTGACVMRLVDVLMFFSESIANFLDSCFYVSFYMHLFDHAHITFSGISCHTTYIHFRLIID